MVISTSDRSHRSFHWWQLRKFWNVRNSKIYDTKLAMKRRPTYEYFSTFSDQSWVMGPTGNALGRVQLFSALDSPRLFNILFCICNTQLTILVGTEAKYEFLIVLNVVCELFALLLIIFIFRPNHLFLLIFLPWILVDQIDVFISFFRYTPFEWKLSHLWNLWIEWLLWALPLSQVLSLPKDVSVVKRFLNDLRLFKIIHLHIIILSLPYIFIRVLSFLKLQYNVVPRAAGIRAFSAPMGSRRVSNFQFFMGILPDHLRLQLSCNLLFLVPISIVINVWGFCGLLEVFWIIEAIGLRPLRPLRGLSLVFLIIFLRLGSVGSLVWIIMVSLGRLVEFGGPLLTTVLISFKHLLGLELGKFCGRTTRLLGVAEP